MSRYGGRVFSQAELQTLRALIDDNPGLRRAALSRLVCERLDWRSANGCLSEMSCRVAMLRMHEDGVLQLPPSRNSKPRRPACFASTAASDPQPEVQAPVHDLPALRMQLVHGAGAASRLWNEFMARYHELGYTPMSGHQMRYSVYVGEQLVALISFGASAWKLADRDRFIGWSAEQRRNNLPFVVNNTRFLVLPWIRSHGLASKVLAMAARRVLANWPSRYGYAPVMLETFVEIPQHKGTCYKAANWQRVGQTKGRGKTSTSHIPTLPTKDIWLYPLRPDFRSFLCR